LSSDGSLAAALDAATDTLAASSTFQSRVGAASAAAAKARIFWDNLLDNDGHRSQRPFAIVKLTSRGANQVGEGIAIDLLAGGGVLVY